MKSKHSAEEKFQIVTESFTDNVSQAEICRRHGIYPVQLIKWRNQFIQGGKAALAQRGNSDSREIQNHPMFQSKSCSDIFFLQW
jgi:transposase-like protein